MWLWIIIAVIVLALSGAAIEGFSRPFERDNIKRARQNTDVLANNQRLKELEREKEILELRKEIEELKKQNTPL